MKASRQFPIAPGRTLSACVCLVVVVLLWAPMWAAAWQADGMACCLGGMCAAHGHAATGHARQQQAAAEKAPMDCEPHRGSGIADCTISCGHRSSQSFATAMMFVLPGPASVSLPADTIAGFERMSATEFVPSFEPPYPPPRTSFFAQ